MNRSMILVGMAIGAGLMYGLDPQQGNRRRALARDKFTKAMHKTSHAVGATSRDVAHRATGLAASMQTRFFEDDAPDAVVEARVRARLGRVSSHPGAVEVHAERGFVILRGPAFRSEVDTIVKAISSVRGVERVDNRLEPHEVGDPVAALRGRPPLDADSIRREWSPATRLGVGLTGATLTSVAMVRHDRLGMLLGGVGLALVLRAVGDVGIDRLFAFGSRQDATTRRHSHEGVSIPVRRGPLREGAAPPEPLHDRRPPGTVHSRSFASNQRGIRFAASLR